MPTFFRSLALSVVVVGLVAGCATPAEDEASSSSELSTVLHEPAGAERSAIFVALDAAIAKDLHGQKVYFNSTNPVGRFQAHGGWAFYSGILEGADGNTQPIDYSNSELKWQYENGYLEGVQRGGHFAAKFQAALRREADGSWRVANERWSTESDPWLAYAIGGDENRWISWAELPAVGERDVFPFFPSDSVHEPQGDERRAIISGLRAQLTPDVHGQTILFNSTSPRGHFQTHDGWCFYKGIIEGPNGNGQAVNYADSVYRQRQLSGDFKGVLVNGNFAPTFSALLHLDEDGVWRVVTAADGTKAYQVGRGDYDWTEWTQIDGISPFAYDIFAYGAEGGGH